MKNKVGIVGYGWVGKSMKELFPVSVVYDPALVDTIIAETDSYIHSVVDNKKLINECDTVFICVPTPSVGEGRLNTSIVEEVIGWCDADLLVVRSTVNPTDCDRWTGRYRKNIVMQPEFLGETPAHPLLDPKTRPWLVLGGDKKNVRKLIELYTTVYNANTEIRQLSLLEAEVLKLTENRSIAFRVAEAQELYDVCELAGVDFYTIRDAHYGTDPRFNLWFTMIYPDERGMNSKCIPKDVYAWAAWAESLGYNPKITRALLNKNKDWVQ